MNHLQIIKILDYIYGTLEILLGTAVLAGFFLGAAAFGLSGEAQAGIFAFVFGTFGTIVAGLFLTLGALRFAAGSAITSLRNWSRIYHIVISIFGLLSFPFGTAYGIYCPLGPPHMPGSTTAFCRRVS